MNESVNNFICSLSLVLPTLWILGLFFSWLHMWFRNWLEDFPKEYLRFHTLNSFVMMNIRGYERHYKDGISWWPFIGGESWDNNNYIKVNSKHYSSWADMSSNGVLIQIVIIFTMVITPLLIVVVCDVVPASVGFGILGFFAAVIGFKKVYQAHKVIKAHIADKDVHR